MLEAHRDLAPFARLGVVGHRQRLLGDLLAVELGGQIEHQRIFLSGQRLEESGQRGFASFERQRVLVAQHQFGPGLLAHRRHEGVLVGDGHLHRQQAAHHVGQGGGVAFRDGEFGAGSVGRGALVALEGCVFRRARAYREGVAACGQLDLLRTVGVEERLAGGAVLVGHLHGVACGVENLDPVGGEVGVARPGCGTGFGRVAHIVHAFLDRDVEFGERQVAHVVRVGFLLASFEAGGLFHARSGKQRAGSQGPGEIFANVHFHGRRIFNV